jgi:hypothetical protein
MLLCFHGMHDNSAVVHDGRLAISFLSAALEAAPMLVLQEGCPASQ